MEPIGDPYHWVTSRDWEQPDQALVTDLQKLADKKVGALAGAIAPERYRAVVRALRSFNEDAGPIAKVYTFAGSRVLEQVCHAVFGWDLILSLQAHPHQMRRVLVLGETGTGKERISKLIARTLQKLHGGEGGKDWSISAANFQGDTLRSELFGHMKGAFTGAMTNHLGILGAMSEGEALFIDEVGEASQAVQTLLLRAIQEGRFRAVGALGERSVRFHLVAATNRSEWELRQGEGFRSDLYYRLASPQIELPPLRELLADAPKPKKIFKDVIEKVIEDLKLRPTGRDGVGAFLDSQVNTFLTKQLHAQLDEATRETGYTWPGNFRELRNVIAHLIYAGTDKARTMDFVARLQRGQSGHGLEARSPLVSSSQRPQTMAEVKRAAYERACANNHSVTAVARELDVSRQTAHERIKAYGLTLRAR